MNRAKERLRVALPFLIYATLMTAFLCYWHGRLSRNIDPLTIAFFFLFSATALVIGDLFCRLSPLPNVTRISLTARFTFGYLLLSAVLMFLVFSLPMSITWIFAAIAICALLFAVLSKPPRPASSLKVLVPDFLCLGISGLAATFWCADVLRPISWSSANVIFNMWQDVFFHVSLISTFSQSHGFATISDPAMFGARLPIYHYGSYFAPSAMVAWTGARALDAFSGFQLPFGVLLSGLAAFVLVSSQLGRWPGVASCSALLLVPDAFQQGFDNNFLSYNFMQQANPGGLYGVACAATAWVFILHGCRSGRLLPILMGYGIVALTALFKSHIFIATAYLALIYPCFFFRGAPIRQRAIAALSLTAIFCGVIWWSQRLPNVPTLRLDFSSAGAYTQMLLGNFNPGSTKDFFYSLLMPKHPKAVTALYATVMIMTGTFGLWILAGAVTTFFGWKKLDKGLLLFPIFVVANYQLMAIGLAGDSRGVSFFEELLNRPLVWAYFVLASWVAGLGYLLLFGETLPKSTAARIIASIALLLCFSVPWMYSRNLQTMASSSKFQQFSQFNSFPKCLVQASFYIRDRSQMGEVVLDSDGDPKRLVTALSQRPDFQSVGFKIRFSKAEISRHTSISVLEKMTDSAAVRHYMRVNGIEWFLLHPMTKVGWPESLQHQAVFQCGGFRTFHFSA